MPVDNVAGWWYNDPWRFERRLAERDFINMKVLYAADLPLNSFTEITDGAVKLKKSFNTRISGQDQEIDRGRLAAFSLGLQNMTEITELEVSNV